MKEPDELVLSDPYRAAEAIGLNLARLDPAPDRSFAHRQRRGGLRDRQQPGKRRRSIITLLLGLAFGGRGRAVLTRDPLTSCGPREQPDEVSQTVLAASIGRRSGTKGAMRVAGHAWHLGRLALPKSGGKKATPYLRPLGGRAFLIRSATASAVFEGA